MNSKEKKTIKYELTDVLNEEDRWVLTIQDEVWNVEGKGELDSSVRSLIRQISERGVTVMGARVVGERIEHYGITVKEPSHENFINGLMGETFRIGVKVKRVEEE